VNRAELQGYHAGQQSVKTKAALLLVCAAVTRVGRVFGGEGCSGLAPQECREPGRGAQNDQLSDRGHCDRNGSGGGRGLSMNTQTATAVGRLQLLYEEAGTELLAHNWTEALSTLQAA
jgi:hypothetical protein